MSIKYGQEMSQKAQETSHKNEESSLGYKLYITINAAFGPYALHDTLSASIETTITMTHQR